MSEGRMQRAQMWEYFSERKVSADKLGRKKDAEGEARRHIKYECTVNGDRLVIGQWRCLGVIDTKKNKAGKTEVFRSKYAELIGVYYMTPSGQTNITLDGRAWSQGKVEYIALGGWNYYTAYNTYGYKYECIGGKDEALAWLKDHFGEYSWYYSYQNDVFDVVDHVETHMSMQRRMNTEQRRIRKWSDWAAGMPPLPEDFEAWARETAFGALEYAFGDKDSDKYFCTACGRTHKQKTWKHRGRYECSRTGKRIKVEKVEKNGIERRERLMIIQSYKTVDGEICSVARHFTARCSWSRSGSVFILDPDAALVLRLDGSTCCGDDIVYNIGPQKWDVRNPFGYRFEGCYCYPDVSALEGTAYGKIGIDAAATKGWRLNYNNLMRAYYDDPRMEYLIKGNFQRLVCDKTTNNCYCHAELFKGNTVQEVLGIDGQSVARLRQANGGSYYLDWLRAVYMSYGIKKNVDGLKIIHGRISEDAIRFFCEKRITSQEVAFALNLGMSPDQIANYLRKKHGYKLSDRRYLGNVEHVVISQWRDYLAMANKLKLDTSRESVYKPKVLRERHDELTELINAKQAKIEAERIESEYPAIKPVCERIKPIYEWGDGEYLVTVPSGAAEIQREGRLLRHCVGTTDRYFDRIAEEESYIMFLRKSCSPSSPWYTMEVEPGGAVRQLRTFGDDEGNDRDEAKAFLKKWRAEIAKRLGDAEREAAQVSREKRLKEFEELRRNGNLIRNGKLAGKLLVEVLESDFKEYNEGIA